MRHFHFVFILFSLLIGISESIPAQQPLAGQTSLDQQFEKQVDILHKEASEFLQAANAFKPSTHDVKESCREMYQIISQNLQPEEEKRIRAIIWTEAEIKETDIWATANRLLEQGKYREAEAKYLEQSEVRIWRINGLARVYTELAKQPENMEKALEDFWLIENLPGDVEIYFDDEYREILAHYLGKDDTKRFKRAVKLMKEYYMISEREKKHYLSQPEKLKNYKRTIYTQPRIDFVRSRYLRQHIQSPTYGIELTDLTSSAWYEDWRNTISDPKVDRQQNLQRLACAKASAIKASEYNQQLYLLYRWGLIAIAELEIGEVKSAQATVGNISDDPTKFLLQEKRFQYNNSMLAYIYTKTKKIDSSTLIEMAKRQAKNEGDKNWLQGACAALVEDGQLEMAHQILHALEGDLESRIHARTGIICGLVETPTLNE